MTIGVIGKVKPAMKHRFGGVKNEMPHSDDLRCANKGCETTWHRHQRKPLACEGKQPTEYHRRIEEKVE